MIALSLFVLLCAAGVVYLLWFLSDSDRVAAVALKSQQAEASRSAPSEGKSV